MTGCRLSTTRKQYEERLDELESRLGERDSVSAEAEKMRSDVDESVGRRLNEMRQQVLEETADKCHRLEDVRVHTFLYII